MAEPYVRFQNTPPVMNGTTVVTPGKLELWDVDDQGVEKKWPQRVIDNIVDARVLLRPDGKARIRIVLEVGDAVGVMKAPDAD